jgi:exosortase
MTETTTDTPPSRSTKQARCSPQNWRSPQVAWGAALILALALLYLDSFSVFVARWFSKSTFYHCLAVPPMIYWLVSRRWSLLQALPARPARSGVVVLGCGLLVAVLGTRLGINLITGVSFPVTVAGLILLLRGRRALRLLAMPLLVSFFLIAPPEHVLGIVTMPLQKISAALAGVASRSVLGIPVTRQDIVLELNGYRFVVAEQCSGMSSFLAMVLTVIALVEFSGLAASRKLLTLAGIPAIVIVANVVRLCLVLIIAQYFGPQVALGEFVHGATDAVVYICALILVIMMLNALLPRDDRAESVPESRDADAPPAQGG